MKERILQTLGRHKKAILSKEFFLALIIGAMVVVTVTIAAAGFFRDNAILSANRNAEIISLSAQKAVHKYARLHGNPTLFGRTFYGSGDVARSGEISLNLELVDAFSGSYAFKLGENSTKVEISIWSEEVEVSGGDMVVFSSDEQIGDYRRNTLVGVFARE